MQTRNLNSNPRLLVTLCLAALLSAVSSFAPAAAPPPVAVPELNPVLVKSPVQWMQEFLGRLDLTPEQIQQILEVFRSHAAELQVVAVEEFAARTLLNQAVHQCTPNPIAVRMATVGVAAADLQLNLLRAALFAEIHPILTEGQRAELQGLTDLVQGWVTQAAGSCGSNSGPHPVLDALRDLAAAKLGLTEDQRAQLQAVIDRHKPLVCTQLNQEIAARKSLLAAIRKPAVDTGAILAASTTVYEVDVAFNLERADIYAEVCAILTPEQKDKLRGIVDRVRTAVEKLLEALAGVFPQAAW
ncbi:MAG: periplasmic heavy metal sensor [Acidobacteria bacterium]|nr:periplasmic heavy metal sensor [Acidobacteriota bacterium]